MKHYQWTLSLALIQWIVIEIFVRWESKTMHLRSGNTDVIIIIHCTLSLSLSLSLSLHAAIWMYGKFKNAVLSHNKKASLYSRSHFTLCTFAAHCFRYPTSYITTDDRVNSNIGPFRDHSCSFRILTPRIICWYTKIMFFQEQSYRYLWFPKFVVSELKSLTSWKWTLS